jgi:hypothetical protein
MDQRARKTEIMGVRGSSQFALTAKGLEELTLRTHRLDTRLRNILFLISKGTPTVEAILQNSIFPQEEVIEKLRGLLKERFVELVSGLAPAPTPTGAPPQPRTAGAAHTRPEAAESAADQTVAVPLSVPTTTPVFPSLASGISMSQARFLLCDFCLDQFGTSAQPLLDAIEEATHVADLQHVLDGLTAQMRKHLKHQLPALMAKVREINENAI